MSRLLRIARMLVSTEVPLGAYGWDRSRWFSLHTHIRGQHEPIINGYFSSNKVSIDQSPYHSYMKRAVSTLAKQFPSTVSYKIDFDGWSPGTVAEYLKDKSLHQSKEVLPKFLYHGTSYHRWESIQKEGLKPRSQTEVSPAYGAAMEHALPADPNQVYLSATFGNAVRFASRDASGSDKSKPVVLRIDSSGLNYRKLRPDVDSQSGSWEKSFQWIGTVGYEGSIAPQHISLYKVFDSSVRKWVDG